jgi:hypothetical protein
MRTVLPAAHTHTHTHTHTPAARAGACAQAPPSAAPCMARSAHHPTFPQPQPHPRTHTYLVSQPASAHETSIRFAPVGQTTMRRQRCRRGPTDRRTGRCHAIYTCGTQGAGRTAGRPLPLPLPAPRHHGNQARARLGASARQQRRRRRRRRRRTFLASSHCARCALSADPPARWADPDMQVLIDTPAHDDGIP